MGGRGEGGGKRGVGGQEEGGGGSGGGGGGGRGGAGGAGLGKNQSWKYPAHGCPVSAQSELSQQHVELQLCPLAFTP